MPRSFVVCIAAIAVAALAQTAVAAPESDTIVVFAAAPTSAGYLTKQTTIRYGDLNVAEQQDAAALYDRINDAALQTCGAKQDFTFPRERARKIEKCRAQMVKDAVAQVASPVLTQIADAKK